MCLRKDSLVVYQLVNIAAVNFIRLHVILCGTSCASSLFCLPWLIASQRHWLIWFTFNGGLVTQ